MDEEIGMDQGNGTEKNRVFSTECTRKEGLISLEIAYLRQTKLKMDKSFWVKCLILPNKI